MKEKPREHPNENNSKKQRFNRFTGLRDFNDESDINKGQSTKESANKTKATVIVGDSIVKGLRQEKISPNSNDKVTVRSFPGAITSDMKDYIKPILKRNPKRFVIRVGTNDTINQQPSQIVQKITELHHQIMESNPETVVVISELIGREDHPTAKLKVQEVNKLLKDHCNKNRIDLIRHTNINAKSLNGSRLHLNLSGTALLAKNVIIHFKGF